MNKRYQFSLLLSKDIKKKFSDSSFKSDIVQSNEKGLCRRRENFLKSIEVRSSVV